MTSDDLNQAQEAVLQQAAQIERERIIAHLLSIASDHERTAYSHLFNDQTAMLNFRAADTIRRAVERIS